MRHHPRHHPHQGPWGVLIALAVLGAWLGHLVWLLAFSELSLASPLAWLHMAVQAYLSTGLFITGHDAMHGTVSRHRGLNEAVGTAACFLFAGLSYQRLVVNHRAHHLDPTGPDDPDFSTRTQAFLPWFTTFMVRYMTWPQFLTMALKFNVLWWLGVEQWRIWAFWVAPAVAGTFQLFYFGTYRPHRQPHTPDMAPHHARSLPRNHLWAMLSCYFFGYHWEHHQSPVTPWWALWRDRDARVRAGEASSQETAARLPRPDAPL